MLQFSQDLDWDIVQESQPQTTVVMPVAVQCGAAAAQWLSWLPATSWRGSFGAPTCVLTVGALLDHFHLPGWLPPADRRSTYLAERIAKWRVSRKPGEEEAIGTH